MLQRLPRLMKVVQMEVSSGAWGRDLDAAATSSGGNCNLLLLSFDPLAPLVNYILVPFGVDVEVVQVFGLVVGIVRIGHLN